MIAVAHWPTVSAGRNNGWWNRCPGGGKSPSQPQPLLSTPAHTTRSDDNGCEPRRRAESHGDTFSFKGRGTGLEITVAAFMLWLGGLLVGWGRRGLMK